MRPSSAKAHVLMLLACTDCMVQSAFCETSGEEAEPKTWSSAMFRQSTLAVVRWKVT